MGCGGSKDDDKKAGAPGKAGTAKKGAATKKGSAVGGKTKGPSAAGGTKKKGVSAAKGSGKKSATTISEGGPAPGAGAAGPAPASPPSSPPASPPSSPPASPPSSPPASPPASPPSSPPSSPPGSPTGTGSSLGTDFRERIAQAGPGQLIVIRFFRVDCEKCVAVGKFYQTLVHKYANVIFLDANMARNMHAVGAMNVLTVPTFVAFKNHREIGRYEGWDNAELENWIVTNS